MVIYLALEIALHAFVSTLMTSRIACLRYTINIDICISYKVNYLQVQLGLDLCHMLLLLKLER